MNPIDKMLLDHANKIEIRTFPNPKVFEVVFSSLPSAEGLSPLLSLIETGRFRWTYWTKYQLESKKMHELLSFKIEAINLIPVSDAIAALAQMWRDAGYSVAIQGQPDPPIDDAHETLVKL